MTVEDKIKELYHKQLAGEITEEECMQQSLEVAQEYVQPSFLMMALDMIERNPKAVLAAVSGVCHGIRRYTELNKE